MQDKKPVRASLSAVTVVGPSRAVRGSSLGDCLFGSASYPVMFRCARRDIEASRYECPRARTSKGSPSMQTRKHDVYC